MLSNLTVREQKLRNPKTETLATELRVPVVKIEFWASKGRKSETYLTYRKEVVHLE